MVGLKFNRMVLLSQITNILAHESEHSRLLAQSGEHLPYKQRVVGSSPTQPISCEVYQRLDCRPHKPNVVGSSPTLAITAQQRRPSGDVRKQRPTLRQVVAPAHLFGIWIDG